MVEVHKLIARRLFWLIVSYLLFFLIQFLFLDLIFKSYIKIDVFDSIFKLFLVISLLFAAGNAFYVIIVTKSAERSVTTSIALITFKLLVSLSMLYSFVDKEKLGSEIIAVTFLVMYGVQQLFEFFVRKKVME